jgi:hypothetical protein
MSIELLAAKLTVIAAWFIVHLDFAKKIYMTIVMAKLPKYMVSVDPMRIPRHIPDSVSSIFSMQYSANVCARSTKRTRPRSRNRIAPANAM